MVVKRIISNPFYTKFKKHNCPKCKGELELISKNKTLDKSDVEAKNFDFDDNGEGYLLGKVTFIWDVFYCKICNKEYEIKEIKNYEKKVIK